MVLALVTMATVAIIIMPSLATIRPHRPVAAAVALVTTRHHPVAIATVTAAVAADVADVGRVLVLYVRVF